LCRPRLSLSVLEDILEETSNIPALLPSINQLIETVDKAKEWTDKVKAIQVNILLSKPVI
jgi:hypothetical protein